MTLRHRVLVLLPLLALAVPTVGAPANDELAQIQANAQAIQAQAEACGKMKCPVVDCDSLAATYQSLVDAETILDALHDALLQQDAALRAAYNDVASNAHLTGTMIAQLENSIAWEEYFHKIGSYMLKIASITNTLNGIADGSFQIDSEKGALDMLDRLDTLGNLAKNTGDMMNDLQGGLANGGVAPSASDAKSMVNLASDIKSEGVDLAKVARDARNEFKEDGVAGAVDAIKKSRNLLSALGRALKLYSEWKLKQEKAALQEMNGLPGPEAAAVTAAFQRWQVARERTYAAEDALAAVRRAKDALGACMAKAGCGAKTLSRPTLPAFGSWGAALRDLDGRLPDLAKRLAAGIRVSDKCPQIPQRPVPTPPSSTGGTSSTPAPPPPRHVVENTCPQCAALALELARTLDEMEFDGQELHRIRENLEKAKDLEKEAKILRDSIQRITSLVTEFLNGKSDRNALLRVGDAIFRALGKAHTEINIETLEREKREQQNQLHDLESRIAALSAEEGRIPALEKDQLRLYELAEQLKLRLADCQRRCPTPTPPSTTTGGREAKPTPVPTRSVKKGKIRIALVGPSDGRPGERFAGKIVDDPQNWKTSALVRVTELEATLPLDAAGRPILVETLISFDQAPAQTADGPVTCDVPKGGTTRISVRPNDSPTTTGETTLTYPGGAVEPPAASSVPSVCIKDYLFPVHCRTAADPRTARVTVGGSPAPFVTGTPRGWNCLLPADTAAGPATVVYEEGGRKMSAPIAVIALAVGADRTSLLRGESTRYSAKVTGLGSIPGKSWDAPYSPDATTRETIARTAPGLEAGSGERGKVLLVIENRSSETISIDGEKAGRIVLTIDRSAIVNGSYEYKGTIHSKKAGGFNIRATVIPLFAPAPLTEMP